MIRDFHLKRNILILSRLKACSKKLLKQEINKNKVHPDDQEDIIEIYSILTKNELSSANGVNDVHWLGKTFDHSPAVAAIASLTSLQNDILAARSQAVTLIRNRSYGR